MPILCYAAERRVATLGRSDLVFWDLGAGVGKVLITAALSKKFSKIYGVELLDGLHEAAKQVCANFEKAIEEEKWTNESKLEMIHGNMLEIDWSNADVVYASSICFPKELIDGVIHKANLLKKGTIIASLREIDNENFKLLYTFRVKMTWGTCDVHILEKTN